MEEPIDALEVVRFQLSYFDAVKIQTQQSSITARVARVNDTGVIKPDPIFTTTLPYMDQERNRVLAAEAMKMAAAAGNYGDLERARSSLEEALHQILSSASAHEPICLSLTRQLKIGIQRLEDSIADRVHSQTAPLQKISNVGSSFPPTVIGSIGGLPAPARNGSLASTSLPGPMSVIGPSTLKCNVVSSLGSSNGSTLKADSRIVLKPRTLSVSPSLGGASSASDARSSIGSLVLPNTGRHRWRPVRSKEIEEKSDIAIDQVLDREEGSNKANALRPLPGKKAHQSSNLRGRDKFLSPMAASYANPHKFNCGALGIIPPPNALARARSNMTALDNWLCRLLRCKSLPVTLPEDVILHILSYLDPYHLFHESLDTPTLIVDKSVGSNRGAFQNISAAIRAAKPGDRILVHDGVYRESIRLDKPIQLIGMRSNTGTSNSGVTITSARNHTIVCTAMFARMEKLTIRQTGGSGRSCVLLSAGNLSLSESDICSSSGLCIEVTDTATPYLRHNRIHEGAAAGLWFRAGGGGLVEGNEIWGNGWSGVQISDESNPLLLRNFIHENKSAGIISFNKGRGVARENDITSNGKGGVQVRSGAYPELFCNRIFEERSFGVWVYEQGLGRFEDNDVVNNAWSGFQVEEGSAPTVIGNRLRGNRSAGIVVYNRGSGNYEWNDISANGRCGVQIKSESAPSFRHNRIHHEKQAGVLTAEDGTGLLEDNDIFDNQWSGVQTEGPSNPHLRRNRIHHNGGAGFIAYQNGTGLLEANDIYGNKKYGIQSKTGGRPTAKGNNIHDKVYGIYLTESGGGTYEDNNIFNTRGPGIFISADCSPTLHNNVAPVASASQATSP